MDSRSVTPADASAIARIAAFERWARCSDRSAATAAARSAFLDRFERQVDPEGLLDPAERAHRAQYAKQAHFLRLARASAAARRARAIGGDAA